MAPRIKLNILSSALALSLALTQTLTVRAETVPDLKPGQVSVSIPFRVSDNKGWIPEGTIFTVQIKSENGAPLPQKTAYDIDVSGEYSFGPIIFDEPDNYYYTISEKVYDDENIVFDETVYRVTASVVYDDLGRLVCGVSVTSSSAVGKPDVDIVSFGNDYISPPDESSIPEDSAPDSQTDSDPEDSSDSDPDPQGSEPDSETDSMPEDSEPDSPGGDESLPDESADNADSSEVPDSLDSLDSTDSTASSGPGNSSSKKEESSGGFSIETLLPPNTGGRVTLGISGLAILGLGILAAAKRRQEDDGEEGQE